MQEWERSLLDARKKHWVTNEKGKPHSKCAYCGKYEIEHRSFHSDGTDTIEKHSAVMCGRYVYIPQYDAFGNSCICTNCNTTYYLCNVKGTDKLFSIRKNDIAGTKVFVNVHSDGKTGQKLFVPRCIDEFLRAQKYDKKIEAFSAYLYEKLLEEFE